MADVTQLPIIMLRRLKWRPTFWKTVNNPSAPSERVDMYLIVDDETGAGIVSLGVPHGRSDIADYICKCCAVGI